MSGHAMRPKEKGRSDFRTVTATIHQQASWYGSRGLEAEQKRREASSRAQKHAAAGRQIASLAEDIFAVLLPSMAKRRKGG